MLTLNISSLQSAMALVEKTTKRPMADSLNRAALHVIIGSGAGPGAMQLTPTASKAAIRAIDEKLIRAFVIRKLRAKNQLRGKSATEIAALVKIERMRRANAAGYTAFIGWTPAAKALGGTGARGKGKTKFDEAQFQGSEAKRGTATKATPESLMAMIVNTAPMAEEIGFDALQQGVENAAQDLLDYAHAKLQKTVREAGF